MIIIINKTLLDIGKTNDYLIENVQEIISKVWNFKNLTFVLDRKESPKYCYVNFLNYKSNHCYVPFKFKKDDFFKCIEKHTKDLNIKNLPELYIMLHEIGHAKQHETLGDKNPYYYPVIIEQGNNIHYLYNGSSVENKINQFMAENYKEAFADCFAAFALYKEFGNIEIFDKIYEIRKERYDYFKNINGNEFIYPNADYNSIKHFKKFIEKINKSYSEIAYSDIENYLETSLLIGTIKTIKYELDSNDAFLVEFRKYSKEFSLYKKDLYKMKEIESLINIKNPNANKLEIDLLMDKVKNSSIIGFFIEFQRRTNSNKIINNNIILNLSSNNHYDRIAKPKNSLLKVKDYYYLNNVEQNQSLIIKSRIEKLRVDNSKVLKLNYNANI